MVLVPTASWVGQAPWPRLQTDMHVPPCPSGSLAERGGSGYGAVDGAMAYLVCSAPCLEDQCSPHIPGPEELLRSKGQPSIAQAGLTLLHSQASPA